MAKIVYYPKYSLKIGDVSLWLDTINTPDVLFRRLARLNINFDESKVYIRNCFGLNWLYAEFIRDYYTANIIGFRFHQVDNFYNMYYKLDALVRNPQELQSSFDYVDCVPHLHNLSMEKLNSGEYHIFVDFYTVPIEEYDNHFIEKEEKLCLKSLDGIKKEIKNDESAKRNEIEKSCRNTLFDLFIKGEIQNFLDQQR